MSEIVDAAVKALSERVGDAGLDGSVRFVIDGEGAIRVDEGGVAADDGAGDGAADCTVTADADTFRALFAGELDPTAAFMSGRLAIEGDMGLAMKLGSLLG
jgi:putative sterol carrier protein